MEQFRRIGEVLGSLKALTVFRDDIQINQRQCCLLSDMLNFAYESIAEEMRQNLRFEEKLTKWKVLEGPLKELYRIFKDGELYIKQCLETRDWRAKAIMLYQNRDCIEFHIHNLLSCIPIVIEAIEIAGEISGWDNAEIQKKRVIYSMKYQNDCKDPEVFQWRFGKQYLVSAELCNRLDAVWNEDRWILLNKMKEKRKSGLKSRREDKQLIDLLVKNLNNETPAEQLNNYGNELLPCSVLVDSKDYQVKRRLGSGSQYKEIQWFGENFALRHCVGDIEPLILEISQQLSLSHPNIMNILCGFSDEERKECFLVMELMNHNLNSYIKETRNLRKRVPFSLPVAVDLMLQIARGMEYLHSKKIYHGNLNPWNILLKNRNTFPDGYLHAKVSGFGLSSFASILTPNSKTSNSSNQNEMQHPFIWHAPEILEEQEHLGSNNVVYSPSQRTEKSDVYSFGMICFQLLTDKVPFEDAHMQGDKMSRNIRAGERPLFPFHSPKYVTNLTKKCWHTDPNQRPSFSSICRVLRYIKKFLVMNPTTDYSQPDSPMPLVDYCDIESGLLKKFPSWGTCDPFPLSQIPFHMFAYLVVEKDKSYANQRDTSSESGSEATSVCGDDQSIATFTEESCACPSPPYQKKPSASPETPNKKLISTRKSTDVKGNKQPAKMFSGTPKGNLIPSRRSVTRMNSQNQIVTGSPRSRRFSGHASDSEL